jgi:hypothetical protein
LKSLFFEEWNYDLRMLDVVEGGGVSSCIEASKKYMPH